MLTYRVLLDYQQIAFINLILQIVILAMLAVAVWFKSKAKFRKHGLLMFGATLMNLVSFLLVMGPSFISFSSSVIAQPSARLSIVTLAHIILGGLSIVFSVWLVAAWHLQSSTEGCVRRKPMMRITITLWTIALIVGILLYMLLYTDFL